MKKYTLLVWFSLFMVLTLIFSCKKKEDDPLPIPPYQKTGTLTFQDTTFNFDAFSTVSSGMYIQTRFTISEEASMHVFFMDGKPTTNLIEDLATSSTVGMTLTDDSKETWEAKSGTLTVTVDQGYVISSFTDVTFKKNSDASITEKGSGTITTK